MSHDIYVPSICSNEFCLAKNQSYIIYVLYMYYIHIIYPNVIFQFGLGIQRTARQISLENGDVTGGDGKFHMPRQNFGTVSEGAKVGEVLQNFWGTPCEMVDKLWDVLGNLGELLGKIV